MKLFNTYEEAVISNGTTYGVYKNEILGQFCHLVPGGPGMSSYWFKCKPEDHLETLKDFFARGDWMVSGSLYTNRQGRVVTVGHDIGAGDSNMPSEVDHLCFVLKNTAYGVETPEEREEFARLAREHDNEKNQAHEMCEDTTPQQYESLSSSDKPNNQDIAVLEEIIRLKEAECEKLFDDKLALLDEIAWLHNKLIREGRRYGASMKREFIAKMIKDMGGDHGSE